MYFEINKIYRENDVNLETYINDNITKFNRSNITNHKNMRKSSSQYIVQKKMDKYIKYIRSKQMKYNASKKKNLEAIEYIIQIPMQYTKKEYRNKLNKFIDQIKEELIEDTWYLSKVRKTKGKSAYVHILCLDRIVFEDGKLIEVNKEYKKNIYYDPISGKRCKENNKSAQILYKKGTVKTSKRIIYVSDKIRLDYINTNPNEEKENKRFKNFTELIRGKVIPQLLEQIFKNKIYKQFKDFKKKSLKKAIKKKGKKYYVNKKIYLHDKEQLYEQRKVNAYNNIINHLNAYYSALLENGKDYIEFIKEELNSLDKVKKNIKLYERKCSYIINNIIKEFSDEFFYEKYKI